MRDARRSAVSTFLCLLALCGCVRNAPSASSPASPRAPGSAGASRIVTPDKGLEGRVTWFDANLRFVVVTFPFGQVPALDRQMNVYRQGMKVGEVRITGPQRDDSTVGDVVVGDAAVGDAVRDR